jgi:hypothetical protein
VIAVRALAPLWATSRGSFLGAFIGAIARLLYALVGPQDRELSPLLSNQIIVVFESQAGDFIPLSDTRIHYQPRFSPQAKDPC